VGSVAACGLCKGPAPEGQPLRTGFAQRHDLGVLHGVDEVGYRPCFFQTATLRVRNRQGRVCCRPWPITPFFSSLLYNGKMGVHCQLAAAHSCLQTVGSCSQLPANSVMGRGFAQT